MFKELEDLLHRVVDPRKDVDIPALSDKIEEMFSTSPEQDVNGYVVHHLDRDWEVIPAHDQQRAAMLGSMGYHIRPFMYIDVSNVGSCGACGIKLYGRPNYCPHCGYVKPRVENDQRVFRKS